MLRPRIVPLIALIFSAFASSAFAHSYGPLPKLTAGPGDNALACTQCHTTSALNSGAGSVKITLPEGNFYIPGVKQRVAVTVADPAQVRWGFELSARLNSNLTSAQAGDFTPVDNMTQVICEDFGAKPCLTGLSFIQHTSVGTRSGQKAGASFQFDWTPPAANVGPVTFYAAGNAANGNGSSTGDFIYTTSLVVNPATVQAPVVNAGSIVSALTSAGGPVSGNSWMTVFGSNLSTTTRSWLDGDFFNGTMPTSLDGVSVILIANNAPRLAPIAYVSPAQINFLLPTDESNTTVTVLVRNAAGISGPNTITTQANAPQMFTLDGKFVWATHADGTLTGKGAAAVSAGETISIYASGAGVTTPAQIPGVIPTAATPVATPPTITIGGQNATITAATTVPGSPGVYQLTVKVPALTTGDQPVVLQSGTFNSASALLTVK